MSHSRFTAIFVLDGQRWANVFTSGSQWLLKVLGAIVGQQQRDGVFE